MFTSLNNSSLSAIPSNTRFMIVEYAKGNNEPVITNILGVFKSSKTANDNITILRRYEHNTHYGIISVVWED